jgi:hypothetical protein
VSKTVAQEEQKMAEAEKRRKDDSSGVAAPICGCHLAASGEMMCAKGSEEGKRRVRVQNTHAELFPPTSFWGKDRNSTDVIFPTTPENDKSSIDGVVGADWHTYRLHPVTVEDASEANVLRVNRVPFDKHATSKTGAECGFCDDDSTN